MKTNLNIILHLFCCEMFPVKTLSSVWCDLKVKMKREKKKISYQNLPATTRLAQSNPTTQQIGTIQASHPPNQCPSSLPPPDQLKTWPQPLDQHNLKGSMAPATKSTSSTTRSVLPSHHRRPLPQLEPPSHKSKLCHHYSPKPNHHEPGSSDHLCEQERRWVGGGGVTTCSNGGRGCAS